MWGNFQDLRHYGNLRNTWGCAAVMLTLLLAGVSFINFDPVVYNVLINQHGNLVFIADVIVVIGGLLMALELRERYRAYQQLRKLQEAKKVRHEYRKHLQNVQALLYVEAYDEVTDYTLLLENELKAI